MLFRRQSRMDRMKASAARVLPRGRTVAAATAWVVGGLAALTAASSGVSAARQKQA